MAEGSAFFSPQAPSLITQFTWADSLNIYFTAWCQLSNHGRALPAPGFPLDNWQQAACDVCADHMRQLG